MSQTAHCAFWRILSGAHHQRSEMGNNSFIPLDSLFVKGPVVDGWTELFTYRSDPSPEAFTPRREALTW
jgi:hypothetical protein